MIKSLSEFKRFCLL